MPLAAAIIPAVIGGGVALYSASQQSKAASQANAASQQAAQQQLAAQQAALDRVTQLESPFQQGGAAGMEALLQRLGLSHGTAPGAAPANDPYFGYNIPHGAPTYTDKAIPVDGPLPQPAKPSGGNAGVSPAVPDAGAGVQPAQGGPDWNAFLNDPKNADVMAWAQSGHGDPNLPIEQQSMAQRAAYWMQNAAVLGDPRAQQPLPMLPAPAAQPAQPQAPQAPDLMNAPRPEPAAVPAFARPDTGQAPDQGQYFNPAAFRQDPGYQFALNEGQRNLNANFGARGLLKSGAGVQGAIDYGQGMADQQYGNWFNRQNTLYGNAVNLFNANRANTNQNFENDRAYGTNLALNSRDFANTNFNTDRNYQTQRYDTATGNLFSLAQIGQNAAGAVGGASQSYANNAGNIFGAQANSAATAANQRAQANAGAAGSIGGIASNLFNTVSGAQQPFTASTVGNAYPSYAAQAPTMPTGAFTTYQPPVF